MIQPLAARPLLQRVSIARWRRLGLAVVATLAVAWLVMMASPLVDNPIRSYDANVYLNAAAAVLRGQDPYADPDYRYWPAFTMLCMPFAGIQRAWALRLFEGALFLGAGAGVELLRRRAGASRPWAIGLLCGFPFLLGIEAGQASLLVFFLYALGLALAPSRPVLGGFALGLMGLEPDLLPLAAPAVLGAKWRAIPAAAAGACLWPLLSLLTAGPAGLAAMASRLLAVSGRTNHNIGASLGSLVPLTGRAETALTAALLAAVVAFAAALLAWRWRAGRPLPAPWVDVATAVVLALLPYAFIYDLVFLAAPLMRLGGRDRMMGLWWLIPFEATAIGQDGYRGFASLFPLLIAAFLVHRLLREASTPLGRPANLAGAATLAAVAEAAG